MTDLQTSKGERHASGSSLAARQATKYVACLHSPNLNEQDEAAINRWLEQSPENRREYNTALEMWDSLEYLADTPQVKSMVRSAAGARRVRRTGLFLPWAIAACLVLTTSVVFYGDITQLINGWHTTVYATAIGEQKSITLSDGSVVKLNTDSQISVDFSSHQRRVALDRGEVFFDIAKDSTRPFNVRAGLQTISVLGTQFNVRKRGSAYTLAVVDGIVAVHREDSPLALTAPDEIAAQSQSISRAGDGYVLEKGAVMTFEDRATLSKLERDNYFAWHTGTVTFKDKPLKMVVEEINRYSQRKVVIVGEETKFLRVSGILPIQDVEQVLRGLEAAFPLEIDFTERHIIIRKKRQ